MMIAVLRLLEPTSPTIGKISTITRKRERNFPISFALSETMHARNKITATLANSDGWNEKGPKDSHLLDPLYSSPTNSTATASKIAVKYPRNAACFHTR